MARKRFRRPPYRPTRQAAATVYFTAAPNAKGQRQACVRAECHRSGRGTVPVWSHTSQAVRRALATLTEICDCGATYHRAVAWERLSASSAPLAP